MSYSHGELVQLAEEGRRKKMPRYIDADKVLAKKNQYWNYILGEYCVPVSNIEDIPTADVVERKRGEWNVIWGGEVVCSECKMGAPEAMRGCLANRHLEQIRTNFCPNCGADMRGEQDAEIH